jgi:hypothetical protein
VKALLVAAFAGGLAACVHAPSRAPAVDRVAAMLQGRFDNAAQAQAEPQFAAVIVRWTPLWPERDDGRWFLVEQARATTPDAPYRVRVHRLRADGDGGVASDVFLLPRNGQATPGAGAPGAAGPTRRRFAVDALEALPGCTVRLRPAGRGFRGATRGHDCPSTFRGATYTTAEVVLDADGFASWDRGFDADGVQVWGALSGPYVFRRR